MNFLLDTYTLLGLLAAPEDLPIRVQSIAQDRSAVLFLSVVTPWEMAMKTAAGKLNAADILDDFEAVAARGHFTILETTLNHTIRGGLLPLHHRNPFDRLLAAQALDLRIPLISRDRIFERYGVKRIWD